MPTGCIEMGPDGEFISRPLTAEEFFPLFRERIMRRIKDWDVSPELKARIDAEIEANAP